MVRLPRITAVVVAGLWLMPGRLPCVAGEDTAPAAGQGAKPAEMPVYYDYLDANGRLAGGKVMLPVTPLPPIRRSPLDGTGDNRFHMVIVGDGYTASQMDLYATHANQIVNSFFLMDPYKTYRPLFAVDRIDVISNESGVDNDPTQGIDRDTAMDMGFWCGGMERLLCINTSKAWSYASAAPKVDMIVAIANSTKYGGAGYSHLATVSGDNGSSASVVCHEVGHALGGLADEYDYGSGPTYSGSEPGEPNVSKLNAAQMAAAGTKWAAWLGTSDALFDSPVSCYEGAYYCQYGVFRPSENSAMRSNGRPFNLPSAEALILGIYKGVRPIDDSTPTTQTLTNTDAPFVDPVTPTGHPLTVQWQIDGTDIPGANQTSLAISTLHLSLGLHQLSAQVTDETPWVRNETARAAWMRQTLTWNLNFTTGIPDLDGDRDVDQADFTLFRDCFTSPGAPHNGSRACQIADVDQDGDVDQSDFGVFQRCLDKNGVVAQPECIN
jgi:hypothetical protein